MSKAHLSGKAKKGVDPRLMLRHMGPEHSMVNTHKCIAPGKMQVGTKILWMLVWAPPVKLILDKIFPQMNDYVTHKVVHPLSFLVCPILFEEKHT